MKLFEEIKEGKFEPYTSIYTIDELQAEPNQENRNRMIQIIVEYNIKVLAGFYCKS